MTADALLFDLDGTLYVGDEPLPGARELIRTLVRRGVPRRYLTNTTRRSRHALGEWLRVRGFEIGDDELFTAPVAAAAWLAAQGLRRVALYVNEATHEDFAAFERTDERPEAVVIGDLHRDWDFATLNRAFLQLMDGARLVALQKNRYWMTDQGLALDAGPFVAALEYAVGRAAAVVGKPSPAFFRLAVDSLGLPGARVAVLGDDLETDVAGATAAGLQGVLVRTGKFREDLLLASGIRPDRILDSVADAEELLR